MAYTTLITPADLEPRLATPDWIVVDCRFALDRPEYGRQEYERAHIPGAVYAHLNDDLSGPIMPGKTGRHPLPDVAAAARTFSELGIANNAQVVAYDDAGGTYAARLWWMLRWLGHDNVAVLDGGWQRWSRENRPTRAGSEARQEVHFTPRPRPELIVDAAEVGRAAQDPAYRVIDSRSSERYHGLHEPIDPVAGHIPGAISAPLTENLDANGCFLAPERLADRFQNVLGDVPSDHAMFYCGSGVSAGQNLLALAHAGLGDGRLYVGSWSEWITDPERPVARELSTQGDSNALQGGR